MRITFGVCRKRFRRYHVSDLTPIVARETGIHQNDITGQSWPGASIMHGLDLVQEQAYVAKTAAGAGPVLVEIDVKGAGHVEEPGDVLVAGHVG